jgi:hypothetical protein
MGHHIRQNVAKPWKSQAKLNMAASRGWGASGRYLEATASAAAAQPVAADEMN